jgi:hypothetical protein
VHWRVHYAQAIVRLRCAEGGAGVVSAVQEGHVRCERLHDEEPGRVLCRGEPGVLSVVSTFAVAGFSGISVVAQGPIGSTHGLLSA